VSKLENIKNLKKNAVAHFFEEQADEGDDQEDREVIKKGKFKFIN